MVSTPLAARVTASSPLIAERSGDAPIQNLAGLAGVEPHLAAEEVSGIEPAEHEIGVGDGRLGAAAPVAGRPGHRAGAARPDIEAALIVEPGDRAAADADFENVDHVAADREARIGPADVIDRFDGIAAALDHRAFRRGAAHVEGDEIVDTEQMAVACRADAAADRTGLHERDRLAAAALGGNHAAVRAHQQQRAREAALPQLGIEFRDVLADLRPDIGVRGRRRGALELMPFARELRPGGDEDSGQQPAHFRRRGLLVVRRQVRVEEADRERLDACCPALSRPAL